MNRIFSLFACAAMVLAFSGPVAAANFNPLPDTGQTKCYNVAGQEITCPAEGQPLHGQDAQYHGPAPSYTDNGNGTVTDNNTGLVWMKNTADTNNDGSITLVDRLAWQEASDYCSGLGNGWRLPSYTELESIVDYGRYDPAINPVFSCESDVYWSVTTDASNAGNAWPVNFGDGYYYMHNMTYHYYVRCVRGGV